MGESPDQTEGEKTAAEKEPETQSSTEELSKKYGIEPTEPEKTTISETISTEGMQALEEKRSPPIGKILLAVIILIALAAAAYYILPAITKPPEVKYQCSDGSFTDALELCPIPATTTTATTSTTLKVKCSTADDCAKIQPNTTFCDDQLVKRQYLQYTCLHPGQANAECVVRTGTPIPVKTCEAGEYCLQGECYPRTCQNHMRDYNETKVDCGGPCRPCTSTDVLCNNDTDCGKTERTSNYYCKAGNPTANYTHYICLNQGTAKSTCTNKTTADVIEYCGRWKICLEGQRGCFYLGGNCNDCLQNQGETAVDCGGPCQPCATKPAEYDTLQVLVNRNNTYRNYNIWFNSLLSTGNCTNGAALLVRNPDGIQDSVEATVYQNAETYGLQIGYINATTYSALIWLQRT